ncbi:MAG: glycogen synthase [Defluviitaleaceae bacterium]|nr:glycogen synthase [Defluviitaleaceae bacterium]MCL2263076.1 glycogen synthase [Defluviitaleaceae bacterium]
MAFDKGALKVLLVSTEVNPYSKSGGLGDVAGSLPKVLRDMGVDMRVALPKYQTVPHEHLTDAKKVSEFTVHLSWRAQDANVLALDAFGDGDSVYFIENDFYFNRENYYGYGDDFERFAFFTKATLEMLSRIDFKADIVHFNDWHTGLGPTYLRDVYKGFTYYSNMKSLITIHNLHYQGVFGREILWAVGLNDGYFTGGDLEFYGNISYLKGGIKHADAVSTVSETYAHEIQTPAYGYGMDGLLRDRAAATGQIYGITNGIDIESNNPETDPRIFVNFDTKSIEKKRMNKYRLQEELGLPVGKMPMLSMITRLVEQKGFDILSIIMDELLSMDVQLVILGTGEGRYENMFRHYAWRYPDKVSANIKFNGDLAQQIYAASDIFMMPSVYEPCGLGQLFAMRYGTVPLVRKTGGLADTVTHFDPKTRKGNGFLFEDCVASGLMWAIRQAVDCYHSPDWNTVVKNAMTGDYSWQSAAKEYVDMYEKIKG